jgi:molybdopterin converting factor small subunit
MPITYSVDFHIPVTEIERERDYALELDHALTASQLLALLAERFSAVRLLMKYGGDKKLPVAMLVDGHGLDMDELIPDGSVVKIIGAVAGG